MGIFPVNVPNVAGVPPVVFANNPINTIVNLLTSDVVSLFAGIFGGTQWGIFLDGFPVVTADNVVQFSFKQSSSISDYPVEDGSFQSYDKVQIPFDARFTFTAGGNEQARQALLNSLQAIVNDTNLYDVVTPDAVYTGVNITNIDYAQTAAKGVGLLAVEVWTLQVRTTSSSLLSAVLSIFSSGQTNDGTVQATAPTSTQSAFAGSIAAGS